MFSKSSDYRLIEESYGGPGQYRLKRPRRLLLFSVVFLPLLALTQALIFLQPAVYQSKATVLTVAPTDIDQSSATTDMQHVIIQKQILIGQSLLEQTVATLEQKKDAVHLTVDDLKAMLSVEPMTQTNLVQLLAEGRQPRTLQQVVNAWIDVYLKARADYIAEITEKVTAAINKEILLIASQVETKRMELKTFRLAHDILSEESSDNQAHARLQGLNQTLNTALEEEVKTKAKLDMVRAAVAEGKAVVPENDSQSLADMMYRAQLLREKVVEFQVQYTPEYIKLNPNLHAVVKELEELEKKIAEKVKTGRSYATQEAENNYAAARGAVRAIKLQMEQHKQQISEYTSQFAKYKALQEELLKLEELQQKTQQRLVEIEVKQREQYPQVDVVEWASLPEKPIRPDYWLESALAFAACLSLGLFAVWMADYLNQEQSTQHPVMLTGIHLHHNGARPDVLDGDERRKAMAYDPAKLLPQDVPGELLQAEVAALFRAADRQAIEILCLLFNGLSADEIVNLTVDCFDLENRQINVPLRGRRVPMNRLSIELFTGLSLESWRQTAALTLQDIDALLTCAAIDGRLASPEHMNTEIIRFSYMLYLVRQGIKLSDLAKVFGPIASTRLVELGRHSPERAGIPFESVNLDYPVGD
ncbi:MAG: integrase [Methylococcaceae bacterium]|nr:integrase [Methylococcaceae bacterium]